MSESLNMGGYAFYVWGSYAVAAGIFAWNLIAPHLRRKQIVKELSSEE